MKVKMRRAGRLIIQSRNTDRATVIEVFSFPSVVPDCSRACGKFQITQLEDSVDKYQVVPI